MIKAIVFDMDGVLFDTEKVGVQAWNLVGDKLGIDDVDYLISNCRGLNEEDTKRFINEKYNGKFSGEECLKLLHKNHSAIIKESGVPLKKGVYELLSYLKDNKYTIALASSTRKEIVINYLKEVDILKYFDAIVTGDMIKKGKPEPDIYLRACKEINKDPKDCIAIEDSFNGIKSAYRAGMNVIMVPDMVEATDEIEKLLYKKFESLLEVKEFLISLN